MALRRGGSPFPWLGTLAFALVMACRNKPDAAPPPAAVPDAGVEDAGMAPSPSRWWRAFVKAHAAEIAAGETISLDDKSTPHDLVPRGFIVNRNDKPDWP